MYHSFLAASRVVIVNSGIITSHVRPLLATSGIEDITIVHPADPAHPAGGTNTAGAVAVTVTAAALQKALAGASFAMVCLESPASALLDAVNEAALALDLPWLAAQVDGETGYVGPTVIPHQTPCYRCVELRRTANRTQLSPDSAAFGVSPPPALHAAVGALAALDATRMITRMAVPQTAGRILRLDLRGSEMTYHRVLRFPHCPACGAGDTRPLLDRWTHPGEEARS